MTSIVKASRTKEMNFGNDWRKDAYSVRDKLKYTLTNENTQQDVVIVVGCGSTETKIKAHSFMLFIGSQVLERLLEQAKMNNEGMKEIKLPDIRPEAMKFVLKYIYTDFTELENEDGIDILYTSLKLNLCSLAAVCVTKLKNEISAANVLRIFEESVKMNFEELVQQSQQFILKNAGEVFQNEQFRSLSNESLCRLLAFDELEMDEISIFNSVVGILISFHLFFKIVFSFIQDCHFQGNQVICPVGLALSYTFQYSIPETPYNIGGKINVIGWRWGKP